MTADKIENMISKAADVWCLSREDAITRILGMASDTPSIARAIDGACAERDRKRIAELEGQLSEITGKLRELKGTRPASYRKKYGRKMVLDALASIGGIGTAEDVAKRILADGTDDTESHAFVSVSSILSDTARDGSSGLSVMDKVGRVRIYRLMHDTSEDADRSEKDALFERGEA